MRLEAYPDTGECRSGCWVMLREVDGELLLLGHGKGDELVVSHGLVVLNPKLIIELIHLFKEPLQDK